MKNVHANQQLSIAYGKLLSNRNESSTTSLNDVHYLLMEMGNNVKNMKTIVYLTTNKVNNKIYIGVHDTETPEVFDGYLGCGAYANQPNTYNKTKYPLHLAILKYGPHNFYRSTIRVFDNREDALKLEAELVNETFIQRADTYNIMLGGGDPPRHDKVVYEFNLQGELIKRWDSIIEATKYYHFNKDRIRMCINDKRSINDTFWSEDSNIDVSLYRISPRGSVYQYNEVGYLLHIFNNATEASQKLDIDRQAIISAVHGRTKLHGCYYLHADENIETLLNSKQTKIKNNIRSVYRYSKDGQFEKEYDSLIDAERDTGANHSNICRAIKNGGVSGGYKWSYIKSDTLIKYTDTENKKAVKVAQYDLDHNLIKIWDTISECKKEFPSCLKVCRKQNKSTKGYIFEYVKDIV